MGAIFFAQWLCPCGQCHDQNVFKTSTWLLLSSLQGIPVKLARQQTTPELRTFQTLPPEPTPARTGILQNPPAPSATCLQNLHRHAPEPSDRNSPEPSPELTPAHTGTGTLQNLPERASGTYTSTRRNPPKSSGACFRNLHQHTPEPSKIFRNLPPEPAPAAHTGAYLFWS